MNKGPAIVLGMLAIGFGLGAYAWLHHWRESQRIFTLLGEQAQLIRHAPVATLLRFREFDTTTSDHATTSDQKLLASADRIDISELRGLVHARHSLVVDFNFEWEARRPPDVSHWDFGLQFSAENAQATLLFDLNRQVVRILESKRELAMKPELANAFRKKLSDWSTLR